MFDSCFVVLCCDVMSCDVMLCCAVLCCDVCYIVGPALLATTTLSLNNSMHLAVFNAWAGTLSFNALSGTRLLTLGRAFTTGTNAVLQPAVSNVQLAGNITIGSDLSIAQLSLATSLVVGSGGLGLFASTSGQTLSLGILTINAGVNDVRLGTATDVLVINALSSARIFGTRPGTLWLSGVTLQDTLIGNYNGNFSMYSHFLFIQFIHSHFMHAYTYLFLFVCVFVCVLFCWFV